MVTAEVTMGLGLNPNPCWYHQCLSKVKSPDTVVLFVFGLNHKASALPKVPACARLSQTLHFPDLGQDKTNAPDVLTSVFIPGGPHGPFVYQQYHEPHLGVSASITEVGK